MIPCRSVPKCPHALRHITRINVWLHHFGNESCSKVREIRYSAYCKAISTVVFWKWCNLCIWVCCHHYLHTYAHLWLSCAIFSLLQMWLWCIMYISFETQSFGCLFIQACSNFDQALFLTKSQSYSSPLFAHIADGLSHLCFPHITLAPIEFNIAPRKKW